MKRKYETPQIEVIEIEVEDAVLGMSTEGFGDDGVEWINSISSII